MNEEITLEILPETELKGMDILKIKPPETMFFWDHGSTTFLCGKCKTILAESVVDYLPGNKVLLCNKCGSYNHVPWKKQGPM